MKTAEVAIEHVLTGLLALCAFLLPLLSGLKVDEKLLQGEALFGVLGLAYLFGVVFDRLADTILSPIEEWLRLRLACEFRGKKKSGDEHDPFPQDRLEYCLRGEDGRIEWMDSLRSRIRTSRGLAVLGLPAAMGIAIYLSVPKPDVRWNWWPHGLVALNLFFIFLSVAISSVRPKQLSDSTLKVLKVIKADQLLERLGSIRTDELSANDNVRKKQMDRTKKRMLILSSFYFLLLLNCIITIARIAPLPKQFLARVVILLSATLATALPLWVWYRITETHMRFIYRKLLEVRAEKISASWVTGSSRQGN
jgi:hypothetical protein